MQNAKFIIGSGKIYVIINIIKINIVLRSNYVESVLVGWLGLFDSNMFTTIKLAATQNQFNGHKRRRNYIILDGKESEKMGDAAATQTNNITTWCTTKTLRTLLHAIQAFHS